MEDTQNHSSGNQRALSTCLCRCSAGHLVCVDDTTLFGTTAMTAINNSCANASKINHRSKQPIRSNAINDDGLRAT
jgi:hypothetical protein